MFSAAELLLPVHQPPSKYPLTQADPTRIHEILKRCAKLANTCVGQSISNLNLFFNILDSYIFFTKQKQIIEDKDDAVSQIREMIEAKLSEPQEGEENKNTLAQYKKQWEELQVKYK